ncbi:MAG: hypothetical protein K0Q50_1163 [Vampirovibrio sp.]|jgi:hypothetical protein|nr:hypothetical protein [Vampirovibrio sp.]
MKQHLIAYMLLAGLMLNPAYAGTGINTENDLLKIGAKCIAIYPVAMPVMAVKRLIQKKPDKAVEMIALTPLLPIMGVTMIGSGIFVKAAKWLPKTSSTNHRVSTSNRMDSITTGRASSVMPQEIYLERDAEPDFSIDEAGLSP